MSSMASIKNSFRLVILAGVLFAFNAVAQEAGRVTRSSGKATITSSANQVKPLANGDTINSGDTITTEEDSQVLIRLKDNSTMAIRPKSKIIIAEFTKTLHTKEIDAENKEGFFLIYKRVISRLILIDNDVNPEYQYAKLDFTPDPTTPNNTASVYLPFYNKGWWSVLINKSGNNYLVNFIFSPTVKVDGKKI